MFYRENGQFKTSYRADQQILPIRQDRVVMALLLVFAFAVVPMLASDYFFRAILIPFLIMSLAALGVNILVGYCGQISLGSGAFMAVGAYGAYNFFVRIPGLPLIPALVRHLVWLAQLARQRAVFGRGHFGGAVFQRLDVFAHQVADQRLAFGLGVGVRVASVGLAD